MKERFCPCKYKDRTLYVNMRYVEFIWREDAQGYVELYFSGTEYRMTDEAAQKFCKGEDFCTEM